MPFDPASLLLPPLAGKRWAASLRRVMRRFPSRSGPVDALADIDLDIAPGGMTVIAGPSGSGKSTLLGIIACADRPDEGSVIVGGVDVLALSRRGRRAMRRTRIGVVLPQPSDNLLDELDVAANLHWSASLREQRDTAASRNDAVTQGLLAAVGLAEAGAKRVRHLSGGEQQRLAVACALAGGPDLVVLDEPTASLDHANSLELIEVLRRAAATGATLVVASHDEHVVAAADEVVRLDHGRRVS